MSSSVKAYWSRSDIPDLCGKICIVTGSTEGIGYETALGLVQAGAREVILVGRNTEKGNLALELIKSTCLNSKTILSFSPFDVGSLASVAGFAKKFNERNIPLDILVNNAGVFLTSKQFTVDGYEAVIATNHLGPFALTAQLMPSLRKSPAPRIVNVSSGLSYLAKMDFDDFQSEKRKLFGFQNYAYPRSKLANLLFTFELQRRSDQNGWGLTVVAIHPGLVKTNMTAIRPGNDSWISRFTLPISVALFGMKPFEGATFSLFASTSLEAKPGGYYGPNGFQELYGQVTELDPPNASKDLIVAKKLWQVSEELTRIIWPN